ETAGARHFPGIIARRIGKAVVPCQRGQPERAACAIVAAQHHRSEQGGAARRGRLGKARFHDARGRIAAARGKQGEGERKRDRAVAFGGHRGHIGVRMPDDNSLALYVHWPFCVSKCPYCDFNSHVRAEVDQAAWRAGLLADLAHEAAETSGRKLGSIFFGGGTPSLMPPETVAAVIGAAEKAWGFADDM